MATFLSQGCWKRKCRWNILKGRMYVILSDYERVCSCFGRVGTHYVILKASRIVIKEVGFSIKKRRSSGVTNARIEQ